MPLRRWFQHFFPERRRPLAIAMHDGWTRMVAAAPLLVAATRDFALSLRAPRRAAGVVILVTACVVSVVRCTSTPAAVGPAPEVQVLLDRDMNDVRAAIAGAYTVEDGSGRAVAGAGRLVSGRIRATDDGGLDLNGVALDQDELLLRPKGGEPVQYGGKSWPGSLRVRRDPRGHLEVHNVVDIEDYLAGVLFSEMPSGFPTEALKAQVVAARTYARWRLDHGDPLLRATDADQVYGGAGSKYETARAIVAATRGVVLEVDGRTLPAYFSSTCGGATVDGPDVFPNAPRTGLTGVKCEWCRESPKWRWSRRITLADLSRRLGPALGTIEAIDPRRDDFGHSLAFAVRGRSGARTLQGQEFRRLWNAGASDAEKLPSAWLLELDLSSAGLAVEGAGFGHGVGLCQYGAAGLAKAGRSWQQIVAFYYAGAAPVRRW